MDASDQAAEQIIRIALQGSEVTLRLTGSLAKNTAALLFSAAQNHHQHKGNATLATMLKTEKELSVFQLRANELEVFKPEAKKYGVLFHLIEKPENPDSGELVDVLVRTVDAAKMNRIYDKLGIGVVEMPRSEKGSRSDYESSGHENREGRTDAKGGVLAPEEPDARDGGVITKDAAAHKLAALRASPVTKEAELEKDPLARGRVKDLPLENTSEKRMPSGKAITDRDTTRPEDRPSVKCEIKEIEQEKRTKEQARAKERRAPDLVSKQSDQAPSRTIPNKKEGR